MKLKHKICLIVLTFPIWLPIIILYFWIVDLYEHLKNDV